MKVLLLTDGDVWAGTERHMLELALGLRELEIEVVVAAPERSVLRERVDEHGLRFVAIEKQGSLDVASIAILTRLLRSGDVDLVHAHNGRVHLNAALALARARRGKLVFTQHFLHPNRTRSAGLKARVMGAAHAFAGARTTRFLAISQAVAAAMRERGDAPDAKIRVVLNGIGAPDQTSLRPVAQVRAELEVPEDAPLIFCAARLNPEKDVATLIEAFALVARQRPDAHLRVAGRGELQNALQERITALDLGERARLCGFVSDTLSLHRAADVFVLPSPDEPFGLVFLEAMALAKPVVACAGGAAPEIVATSETGLLGPPRDADTMAANILSLLADPERARAMGHAGEQRFERLFSRRAMAQAALAAYQEALANR